MPTIVLGSTGQIATALRELNLADMVFLDRQALDFERPELFDEVLSPYKPALIINCVAYTAVDKAEIEKEIAYQINAHALEALGKFAKSQNIPVIHLSTDYVFDGKKSFPYTEFDEPNPINYYGFSKRAGEIALLKTQPKCIILRTSAVFSKNPNNFVNTIVRLNRTREKIDVVNDQFTSPTSAKSLAKGIQKVIETLRDPQFDHWGIYHYAQPSPISWYEFAKKIVSIFSLALTIYPIASEDYPTAAKRPRYAVLNCDKFMKTFKMPIAPYDSFLNELKENAHVA